MNPRSYLQKVFPQSMAGSYFNRFNISQINDTATVHIRFILVIPQLKIYIMDIKKDIKLKQTVKELKKLPDVCLSLERTSEVSTF